MCNFPEPPSPQPLSQKGRGAKIWIGSPSPTGRRGWGMRADFKLHIAYKFNADEPRDRLLSAVKWLLCMTKMT